MLTPTLIPTLTPTLIPALTPSGGNRQPFISSWKTDNAGTSNNDQITIPAEPSTKVNGLFDWGDGNTDFITVWDDPALTHTYSSSGTYTVTITGQYEGWRFNNGGDKDKLIEISQIGILEFGNNDGYFYGCTNLVWTATDIPNLVSTTTMLNAFRLTPALTTIPNIHLWPVQLITSWNGTWRDSAFNSPINFGSRFQNVSSVNNMVRDDVNFNQEVEDLNISGLSNLNSWLFGALAFNKSVNNIDVSAISSAASTLRETDYDDRIDSWDIRQFTGNALNNFLRDSPFSQVNYDPALVAFAALSSPVVESVVMHFGTAKYDSAGTPGTARAILILRGNVITDGGAA